ncbi:MAG: CBS domain-containing protein [Chloroflexi bacterium]|nr:CBS domain-containing protein [Chloroflexota bacterium]MDA8187088.1 CBS domain-containing protein [Dehalococcoidales bacterium]
MATAIHYLSQLTGKPVFDPEGRPVGRLGDLVVLLSGPFPPVTGLTLRLGGAGKGIGPLATFLHWSQVASVSKIGISLSSARLDLQAFRRRPGELLLETDLLDQQVMDLNGRKLVRVNDVQIVAAGVGGADLRLAGIDVGVRGLLRRLGIDLWVRWLESHTRLNVPDRVISWEIIEPIDLSDLPADLEGGVGNGVPGLCRGIKLTYEKLAGLHPADVAELVAQMSAPERAAVMESLDAETAAEALGELDTDIQADVLEDLPTETAVEILAELPPDEAADVLAEVSAERADELLGGLDAEEAKAVRELMAYPADVAGGMMTTDFVALQTHLTAQETIDTLRELAPSAEIIYYVYVVDDAGTLVGVLSLRDLIVSPPSNTLSEIVRDRDEVVHVPVDLPEDEVIQIISKYNLLALPVTDKCNRLVGVITVDDALAASLPEVRHWLPRVRG